MWFTNEFLLYSDKLAYETINNILLLILLAMITVI